jgi:cytochrome c
MPTRFNTRVAAIAAAVSIVLSATVVAEDGADNTANIKRIGEVNVAGSAPAAPAASALAAPAPEAAPVAEAAPAAAPAAPAAASDPGAALYAAKTCNVCHGADGKTAIMPTYPRIAGQGAAYLVAQMKDIKSGARSNAQSGVMKGIVANVSDEEMQAIAEWLSKQ